jgi:hypothetical protein
MDLHTDILLVYLVRVQLICNKVIIASWNDSFGDSESRAPSDIFLKAVELQLDGLQKSIPPELKLNGNCIKPFK